MIFRNFNNLKPMSLILLAVLSTSFHAEAKQAQLESIDFSACRTIEFSKDNKRSMDIFITTKLDGEARAYDELGWEEYYSSYESERRILKDLELQRDYLCESYKEYKAGADLEVTGGSFLLDLIDPLKNLKYEDQKIILEFGYAIRGAYFFSPAFFKEGKLNQAVFNDLFKEYKQLNSKALTYLASLSPEESKNRYISEGLSEQEQTRLRFVSNMLSSTKNLKQKDEFISSGLKMKFEAESQAPNTYFEFDLYTYGNKKVSFIGYDKTIAVLKSLMLAKEPEALMRAINLFRYTLRNTDLSKLVMTPKIIDSAFNTLFEVIQDSSSDISLYALESLLELKVNNSTKNALSSDQVALLISEMFNLERMIQENHPDGYQLQELIQRADRDSKISVFSMASQKENAALKDCYGAILAPYITNLDKEALLEMQKVDNDFFIDLVSNKYQDLRLKDTCDQ